VTENAGVMHGILSHGHGDNPIDVRKPVIPGTRKVWIKVYKVLRYCTASVVPPLVLLSGAGYRYFRV
jgi:hypothetical protein